MEIAERRKRDRRAEIGADGEALEARRRLRRRAGDHLELGRVVDDPVRVRVLPLDEVLRGRLAAMKAPTGEAGQPAFEVDTLRHRGRAADAKDEILALVRIA